MRRRVVARSPALRAACCATLAWRSTWRASSRSAAPAVVRATLRWLRLKSLTPSSCSSLRTCSLTAGCATCRRSAALRKCSSSATATKYLRCRSSTPGLLANSPGAGLDRHGLLGVGAAAPDLDDLRREHVDLPG